MDDMRVNHRSSQTNHQNQSSHTMPSPSNRPKSRSNKTVLWLVIVALLIFILGAVAVVGYKLYNAKSITSEVKSGKFQAVFLTNGQVYFGKIEQVTENYIKLSNIYYLQVQQSVQPKADSKATEGQQNQQLSLAKLGGELHGPEDTMFIDRQQIIFWENLKDDGKVVQAIKNSQK